MAREYRRSVLIYLASKKYGLATLKVRAQQYIQLFGDEISLHDLLLETKEVFLKVPEDETWFPSYIKGKLQQTLKPSSELGGFNLDELYNCIDQDKNFGVFVLKMVVEILSVRLLSWERISEDDTTKKQTHPIESGYEDEATPADEPVYEEEIPPEEIPPEEILEEEIPPADEPAPIDSEEKLRPGFPEPAYEEGASPNEKYVYEEEAPTNGEVAACEDLQVAKAQPIEESYLSRPTPADLELYEDWGSMTSKQKKKMTRQLRSRNLPVPSEDGFISVYVG